MLQEESRVAAVRRFNRFYPRQIGVLQEGLFASPFSVTRRLPVTRTAPQALLSRRAERAPKEER